MPTPAPDQEAARSNFYAQYPGLRDDQNLLDPAIQILDYGPSEILFQRGSPVTHILFLLSGSVEEAGVKRLENGVMRPRLARIVEPVKALGLYDFLYQQPHSTHAIARELSKILLIEVQAFEKLLYYRPDLPDLFIPRNLIERMRTLPLLASLDLTELSYLADATRQMRLHAGERIFDATTNANQLFLIDQGQVQVVEAGADKVRLGNGASFGLPNLDESASAATNVTIFAVPHTVVRAIASADVMHGGPQLRRTVEQTLAQLRSFSVKEFQTRLKQLAGYVSHYFLPANHVLVRQGEMTDSMWVLLPGGRAQLHALDATGQALTTASADGPIDFSEEALLAQTPVDATIEAEANSQWLRLHRLDFQDFARDQGYDLLGKLSRVLRSDIQPLVGKEEAHQLYPWLQDGEGVVLLRHRHWFILLARTWLALLILIGVFFGFMFFQADADPPPWFQLIFSFTGLAALLYLVWQLIDFSNDYLVVTNRRVVRQEKVLFSSIHLQETGLEQIQNVDVRKTFPDSWLGYGLVSVQTAGKRGSISFDYIPDVDLVKQAIVTQMARRQRYRQMASKLEIQRYLEGRLGLKLALPERVRTNPPKSNPVFRWWEQLLRVFTARQERREQRYQQDRIVWRKHWLVLLQQLLWPVLILIIALTFLLVQLFRELLWIHPTAIGPLNLLLAFSCIVLLCVVVWRYVDWHNDTYEVTRNEVIDVEKLPLFFDEKRRTARLQDIDNIRSEVPSTFHYFLNIGNVRLETAAVQGGFTFDTVFDPGGVVTEVRRRIEDARRREEQQRAQQRARELTDWFEMYNRLHQSQQSR